MIQRGSPTVGIDLGTTFSSLAYVDESGTPRMLCTESGQSIIPSVVCFSPEGYEVGEPHLSGKAVETSCLARFVKSHIGTDWRKEYHGHVHTAESISAVILRSLVDAAEPVLGPVGRAVITVPAYFTERRRRSTQHAGEIAGLEVAATLNEPMAAALAFCLDRQDEQQTVLVFDLGGGTFDVTIVRIAPGEIVEIASNGNLELGGRNWDQALIDLFCEEALRLHGRPIDEDQDLLEQLRLRCERAKRLLSKAEQTTIVLETPEQSYAVPVTRQQFEDRTVSLVQSTRMTAELSLFDAGLSWNDLSRVVLVGGATQMPAIRNMLAGMTQSIVDTSVNPVTAVALGAAVYAHQLDQGRAIATITHSPPQELSADSPAAASASPEPVGDASAGGIDLIKTEQLKQTPEAPAEVAASTATPAADVPPASVFSQPPRTVRFVTAHGVGVKVSSLRGPANTVLIPRNAAVPVSATRDYVTSSPTTKETFVRVEITQGDAADVALTEDLGMGRIEGFPAGLPAGQVITVSMEFDESGRLHVRARHADSGREMQVHLDVPGGLTPEEIQEQQTHLDGNVRLKILDPLRLLEELDDDDDFSDLSQFMNH